MSPPWRIASTPAKHVEHLRPQLGAGLGDVGVGDQADAQGGAAGQVGAHERGGAAVEDVGSGLRGHGGASFTLVAAARNVGADGRPAVRGPFDRQAVITAAPHDVKGATAGVILCPVEGQQIVFWEIR